jgi:hypothetical protein
MDVDRHGVGVTFREEDASHAIPTCEVTPSRDLSPRRIFLATSARLTSNNFRQS